MIEVFRRILFYLLLDLSIPLWYYIIVKEKVKDMKQNRITKQLSKGKKQGYYKIKVKQMKMKATYDNNMLDFLWGTIV